MNNWASQMKAFLKHLREGIMGRYLEIFVDIWRYFEIFVETALDSYTNENSATEQSRYFQIPSQIFVQNSNYQ